MNNNTNRGEVISLGFNEFIKNLEQLNSTIQAKALATLVASYHIEESNLSSWIKFESDAYARNRVTLFDHIEVMVMCWKSGQMSPIHNHRGSACVIKVIKGISSEITYQQAQNGLLVPTATTSSGQDSILYSSDEDIHQMGNLQKEGEDLITLHCYSPPLNNIDIFSEQHTFFGGYQSLMSRTCSRISAEIY